MRIITDSAADFTKEELSVFNIRCVSTQIMFGEESYTAGKDITDEEFWSRLMAGENAKTSQPSPDAFLTEFEAAKDADEDAVYIGISSALSGTIQSAKIAADMLGYNRLHIVDSLNGAAGQKLLALAASRLRDEGKLVAGEIAGKMENLRSRVRLFASLDTLENLARSGRIPQTAAKLGNLAQLKPLLAVQDGRITVCGKAFGRHRAIESMARRIASFSIDRSFPVIPLYSYQHDNCAALIKKLAAAGVAVNENMLSALGPSIAPHIGPNAYGIAFVSAE